MQYELLENGRQTRIAIAQATEALKGGEEEDVRIEMVMGSAHRVQGAESVRHKTKMKSTKLRPPGKSGLSPKGSPKTVRHSPGKKKHELGDISISAPRPVSPGSTPIPPAVDDTNSTQVGETATTTTTNTLDVTPPRRSDRSVSPGSVSMTGDGPRRATLSQRMVAGQRGGGVFEPRVEVGELVDAMGSSHMQSMLAASSTQSSPSKSSTETGTNDTATDNNSTLSRARGNAFAKLLEKKLKKRSPRKSEKNVIERPTIGAPMPQGDSGTADDNDDMDWNKMVQSEISSIESPPRNVPSLPSNGGGYITILASKSDDSSDDKLGTALAPPHVVEKAV